MGEVVDLAKKRDENRLILLCSCGCKSWIIYKDGELQCALCDLPASSSGKSWLEKVETEVQVKNDDGVTNVVEFHNNESALRSVVDTIEYGRTNTLIAFNFDGHIIHWTCLETSEQYDWLEKCFKAAVDVERAKRGV